MSDHRVGAQFATKQAKLADNNTRHTHTDFVQSRFEQFSGAERKPYEFEHRNATDQAVQAHA
jgi:hypothetical protein